MNVSKSTQARFWRIWRNAGAIGTGNPANKIIVKETDDANNDVFGGYNYIYRVLFCDVDDEKGMLEYETFGFPSTPNFTGQARSDKYRASIPKTGTITKHHIKNRKTLIDDELDELRKRGVKVVIRHIKNR